MTLILCYHDYMRKLLLVLFLFLILNACGPKYFSCIDMTNDLNADDPEKFMRNFKKFSK